MEKEYHKLTIKPVNPDINVIEYLTGDCHRLTSRTNTLTVSHREQPTEETINFILGTYKKGDQGDPGVGTTTKIEFTISDWVSVAGGFELSLQHNLESNVQATIYESDNEVIVDKNLFNTNTVKLFVPYDYRFAGYAIIKN